MCRIAVRALAVCLAAAVCAAALAATGAVPAGAVGPEADLPPPVVVYVPPVDAPVVDGFRPPPTPWGPGNRGIDYDTVPGTAVRAAAAGEVTFAGQVGGSLHVVVLHADGIRTSSSFLASVSVRRGDRVAQGDEVGTAGESVHFGARVGDRYLDPVVLFDGEAVEVFLVPPDEAGPQGEAAERNALARALALAGALPGRAGRQGAAAAAWARRGAAEATAWAADRLARLTVELAQVELARLKAVLEVVQADGRSRLLPGGLGAPAATHLEVALREWDRARRNCTPPATRPPPVAGRHVAVLVGGLGSSSARAAVWALADPARLGYLDGRVVRFSYRGGPADAHPYGPADTTGDLWVAAAHLRRLLQELHAADPSARIDVVAHSQGGLVAQAALTHDLGTGPLDPSALGALVTLASPHRGARLATLLSEADDDLIALTFHHGLSTLVPAVPGPVPAVRQLSEGSAFLRALDRAPWPEGLRVVSIAAREDVEVPADRSRLPGVPLVVVATDDTSWTRAHASLPASEAAGREVRLALAGLPPTCRSLAEALVDAAVVEALRQLEVVEGRAVEALRGRPPLP